MKSIKIIFLAALIVFSAPTANADKVVDDMTVVEMNSRLTKLENDYRALIKEFSGATKEERKGMGAKRTKISEEIEEIKSALNQKGQPGLKHVEPVVKGGPEVRPSEISGNYYVSYTLENQAGEVRTIKKQLVSADKAKKLEEAWRNETKNSLGEIIKDFESWPYEQDE